MILLEDSMIKHTSGWEITKKVKPECKLFVRTFPGATTYCMADYINRFIFHIGTNELNLNAKPDEIAIELKSE